MSSEAPTICPGSPELPELSEAPGTFYLAPPLQHTRDRLYAGLQDRDWRATFPAHGVMAVEVPAGELRQLLRTLGALMSEPETAAGTALFLEAGRGLDVASLTQARSLSTWTARADHEWLADLEFYLDRMARVAAIRDSHASLNLLKDLEPDFVKLDRELIRGVHASTAEQSIVEAMLGMARKLGITTVAEGIEEAEEYRCPSSAGWDTLRGIGLIGMRPARPARMQSGPCRIAWLCTWRRPPP
ncbi:MAG: EAL domain-containing protein [Halorhodospira sp.]